MPVLSLLLFGALLVSFLHSIIVRPFIQPLSSFSYPSSFYSFHSISFRSPLLPSSAPQSRFYSLPLHLQVTLPFNSITDLTLVTPFSFTPSLKFAVVSLYITLITLELLSSLVSVFFCCSP